MLRTLRKLETEENFPNLIKCIYKEPIAIIPINGKILNISHEEQKQGEYVYSTTSIQHSTGGPSQCINVYKR